MGLKWWALPCVLITADEDGDIEIFDMKVALNKYIRCNIKKFRIAKEESNNRKASYTMDTGPGTSIGRKVSAFEVEAYKLMKGSFDTNITTLQLSKGGSFITEVDVNGLNNPGENNKGGTSLEVKISILMNTSFKSVSN